MESCDLTFRFFFIQHPSFCCTVVQGERMAFYSGQVIGTDVLLIVVSNGLAAPSLVEGLAGLCVGLAEAL